MLRKVILTGYSNGITISPWGTPKRELWVDTIISTLDAPSLGPLNQGSHIQSQPAYFIFPLSYSVSKVPLSLPSTLLLAKDNRSNSLFPCPFDREVSNYKSIIGLVFQ